MKRHDILIVDNDPLSVEVVTRSLNHNGYNIFTADNCESAVKMINDYDFNLVLTELVIGASLDGLKVLHKVKDVSHSNSVIIMTNQPERISMNDLMKLDVDAFLFKPVAPEKILTCVDHCIRQSDMKHAGNDRRILERRKNNGNAQVYNIPDRRIEDRRRFCF